MSGATKLMTAGGGGVNVTPDTSIASDVTLKLPTSGVNNGTLVCSDSSGNVGIGTSSPSAPLQVAKNANPLVVLNRSVATGDAGITMQSDGTNVAKLTGAYGGSLLFHTGSSDTERMRIDSSGNLLVNTTSTFSSGVPFQLLAPNNTAASIIKVPTAGESAIVFRNSSNTTVGSITVGASATTYATSSDYRLKENIQPMQNALDVVAQLNPVTYTWKADGSDGQGFIAHELQAVVPDCVTGEKDAVDAEGNPVYQGIDTSFLSATLTKAIQELSAKNDALEARIAALEAK